ncbi:phage tail tube protein [Orbaceae bacterium ESL0721]|nr:phage tail tube protein [Orbaceae bacterium ESL0721]
MQYQGTAIIRVNGRELESLAGAKLTTGGYTRQVIKGAKVYGYSESIVESTVALTLRNCEDVSVEDINNMTDVTITFIPDAGKPWLMANAWSNGNASIDEKGTISCGFTSAPAKEI